ncbi:YiiD C-terminal domain-containing protein [Fontimonas sp. SYSU GA230001]|uniref:YiiD C-terminal domain-containing protein n=1 Tax=Fontimonas sp. SYSU GA230001 TaxID=3142450 RepID=UPI0032B622F7
MTPAELTEFIHRSIPLTRALAARVTEAGARRLCIEAPLEPNLNPHGTAFGGSLATLGILAGWLVLHHELVEADLDVGLVVRHSELDYLRPVTGTLIADSALADADWQDFAATLRAGRRARITVVSRLRSGADDAVRVRADYVATPQR